MRLLFVALLGTTLFGTMLLLGACGGGGGSRPATGGGGTKTVPFDPDNAPQTPPPVNPPDGSGEPFTYRVITGWGYETTPRTLVARNEAEYQAITDRCAFIDDSGAYPPPTLNFETEMAVAVFPGTVLRTEKVNIEGIVPVGDGADVRWVLLVPGSDWPPMNSPQEPYALAIMTRVEGPVTFTKRTEIVPYIDQGQ